MSLTQMKFDKVWTNPVDFPTHETHEAQVRADMQYLFDSIKTQFNNFIANELAAENVAFMPITGYITANNVQDAIEGVHQEVLDISQGSVADGAITTAKLDSTEGSEAVVTATIRDGAVTTEKIADHAITSQQIADGAISASVLADDSITQAKMGIQSVGTNELVPNCVTDAKLANDAVITARIKDGAVTYAKTTGIQKQHATTTTSLASGSTIWTKTGITGVTATNTVICTPDPASFAQWVDNRVRCTEQGEGSLKFVADTATSDAITVDILILD